MTTTDKDEEFYAFYKASVRGENPAMIDGKPQGGWYRTRRIKGGPWHRVEIELDDIGPVIKIDGQQQPESDHGRIWSFCSKHWVTLEAFEHHEKHGVWPGEDAPPAEGSVMGDNNPPVDLVAQLADKIAAAKKWITDIGGKVTAEEQVEAIANRCGSIAQARLGCEKAHEKEKEPHLTAGRAVDEKYNPTIKLAKAAEKELRDLGSAYRTEQRERERKEQEQAAAEARRVEEERAASARRADVIVTEEATNFTPEKVQEIKEYVNSNVVPLAPPAPPAPNTYGGVVGRKLKDKTVFEAVIEDQDAVYAFHRDEPEMTALLQKFAQRCVDQDITCPGVAKKEKVKLG